MAVPSPRIWALAGLVPSRRLISSGWSKMAWDGAAVVRAPLPGLLDRQRASEGARVQGWSGPCCAMSAAGFTSVDTPGRPFTRLSLDLRRASVSGRLSIQTLSRPVWTGEEMPCYPTGYQMPPLKSLLGLPSCPESPQWIGPLWMKGP